ncbi:MAG TPA: class I SAM-dependent methyltransferase [Pilimelia sp.]|nr:class I SAM-dependent methyltransferase [Pilimelia sp.]
MSTPRVIDAAYARFAKAPLLRRVHGPAYLNVGWHPAADPAAALVDRLLHLVGEPPATVLDVACGRAASTARIAARWPDSTVIGLDRSPALLPAVPPAGGLLVRADATALPVVAASVDLVCCVEAALHFPPRRAFFAEAARVLRPGGRLALTDLLVDPAAPGWAALVPAGNIERSEAEYASALRECGLAVRWVRDITAHTWRPYTAALIAAAAAESPYAAAAVDRLLVDRPVGAYLEVLAEVVT